MTRTTVLALCATAPAAAAFDTTIACDAGGVRNLAAAVAQANNTPGTDTIRLAARWLSMKIR